MGSSRYQRAGAKGGRFRASHLQKMIARQTILVTRPWQIRQYEVLIVLSSLPDIEAIEALYLEHGFKALVTVTVSIHGFLVSITVIQRKDFDADSISKIVQILESFKTG